MGEDEAGPEDVDALVALRKFAWQIAKGLLPYPDAARRRRIRRQAKALVRFARWPGNDATPIDIAQLCLVRSLALQKATHRAVRWRQPEAAALLARSSVENTILGLWVLFADSPMDRLRGSTGQAMKGAFRYLTDGDVLKTELIDLLVEEIGGDGSLPHINVMADAVQTKADSSLTTDLYRRLYVPLSSFFTHANGLALMRQLKSDGSARFRPSYPWHRRGPVRAADACLGIMAFVICGRLDQPAELTKAFIDYANAHLSRSLAPLVVVAGRGSRRSIKWSRVPLAIQRLREGTRYYHSTQAALDPWEVRAARIRADLIAMLSIYEPQEPVESFPRIVELLVRMLVGEPPTPDTGGEDSLGVS